MDFELVIVKGRSAHQTLKLADGVTTVGRHDDCQLRIKSSQVSRRHCQLFEKKGLLLVKDLGSSNGTYVNGKRIQEQRVLEPGDEITVGGIQLRVAKTGHAPPAPTKPKPSRPGDTAVVAPVSASGSDEFEIEFDEEPAPSEDLPMVDIDEPTGIPASPINEMAPPRNEPKSTVKPAASTQNEDAVADFLLDFQIDGDDEPSPTPAAPQAEAEVKKKGKPSPEPAVSAEPGGDDAIADFLLDIKLDEEDE